MKKFLAIGLIIQVLLITTVSAETLGITEAKRLASQLASPFKQILTDENANNMLSIMAMSAHPISNNVTNQQTNRGMIGQQFNRFTFKVRPYCENNNPTTIQTNLGLKLIIACQNPLQGNIEIKVCFIDSEKPCHEFDFTVVTVPINNSTIFIKNYLLSIDCNSPEHCAGYIQKNIQTLTNYNDIDRVAKQQAATNQAMPLIKSGYNSSMLKYKQSLREKNKNYDRADNAEGTDQLVKYSTYDMDKYTSEAPNNFSHAVGYLGLISQLPNNINANPLSIFNGGVASCIKSRLGGLGKNCCSINLTKQEIGLTNECSLADIKLAAARRAKRSHYLGSYCAAKSFMGCLKTREVYCTYSSMLARVIQEQARQWLTMYKPALAMSWGTAKQPRCQGFDESQMQTIDWSALNLTEYTASGTTQFNPENQTSMQQQAETSLIKFATAINKGIPLEITYPNRHANNPLLIYPLEGQGPFTVTAMLTGYWPQYNTDGQNMDPVLKVEIQWGDGSDSKVTRSQLTSVQGIPVFIAQHDYAMVKVNALEHIMVNFYTKTTMYQAKAEVMDYAVTPDPNPEVSNGNYNSTQKVMINTMPGYGIYDKASILSTPK